MKSLFVKADYCYGGPWSSFNFNEVTPVQILEKTFSKAGHPFPLILFMEMDCRIVRANAKQSEGWLRVVEKEAPELVNTVKKHTTNVFDFSEVDFSSYDLVYSEDPIIPQYVIESCPNTLFCYNDVECFSRGDGKFYDIYFNHTDGFSFPQSPETLSCLKDKKQKGIYIEYRSLVHATCKCPHCGERVFNFRHIPERTNMQIFFNRDMNNSRYGLSSPLQNGVSYWKGMGRCKYHLMVPGSQGVRLGQTMLDAASLGLINVGIVCDRFEALHISCRVKDYSEASKLISEIEKDSSWQEEILDYQYAGLKFHREKFYNQIVDALNKKRGQRTIGPPASLD